MAMGGHATQGVEVVATDLGAVMRDAQDTIRSHHQLLQQWGVNATISPVLEPEPEPEPLPAEPELGARVEALPASQPPETTVRCVEWDWSTPSPFHAQGSVDFVLAADVLYDDASIPAFLDTLRGVVREGTVALIAYQHRHAAKEGRAWGQLREWGYEVHTCSPFSARVEQQLGKVCTRDGGSTLEGLSNEQRKYMRLVEIRMIPEPKSDLPALSAESQRAGSAPDAAGVYL
eukprot:COSAG02_NODE_12379_length_1555_cov_169.837912_2_plen_232_part_00